MHAPCLHAPLPDAVSLTHGTAAESTSGGPDESIYDVMARMRQVSGEALERFAAMTNWDYYEASLRFQKVLEVSGALRTGSSHLLRVPQVPVVNACIHVASDSESPTECTKQHE